MKNIILSLILILVYSCNSDNEMLAQTPNPQPSPTIMFSGIEFDIKHNNGEPFAPGNNYWSNDSSNIFVDKHGQLHLSIKKHGEKWYASEVVAKEAMGYGEYTFYIKGFDESTFPKNVVFGCFTYANDSSEIDIEMAFWDDMTLEELMSFVVQPYGKTGVQRFPYKLPNQDFTSRFTWSEDSIVFQTYIGHTDQPLSDSDILHTWVYKGKWNPKSIGEERLRFNLYTYNKDRKDSEVAYPPYGNKPVEVIISKMTFKSL